MHAGETGHRTTSSPKTCFKSQEFGINIVFLPNEAYALINRAFPPYPSPPPPQKKQMVSYIELYKNLSHFPPIVCRVSWASFRRNTAFGPKYIIRLTKLLKRTVLNCHLMYSILLTDQYHYFLPLSLQSTNKRSAARSFTSVMGFVSSLHSLKQRTKLS